MSLPWWRKLTAAVKRSARTLGRQAGGQRGRFFSQLWVERLEERIAPATYQWVGGNSLNWGDAGNWTGGNPGGVPNAQGDVAQFTGSYAAAQLVVLNQAITVGEVDFGTAKNITISGTSVLTLDNTGTGPNAILNVGSG